MLRRLDGDDGRAHTPPSYAGAAAPEQAVAPVDESNAESSLLPRDHPKWAHDAVTVSQRAREIIARLRPVVVKILSFWYHRVRSAFVGTRRVSIDPSGSYRAE